MSAFGHFQTLAVHPDRRDKAQDEHEAMRHENHALRDSACAVRDV